MTQARHTLLGRFRSHVAMQPDAPAVTLLDGDVAPVASLSYAELDQRCRQTAAALAACTTVGDRVVLAFPAGIDFVVAVLACFHAGRVAVPVAVPRPGRDDEAWRHVAEDCGAALALTDRATAGTLARANGPASLAIDTIERLVADAATDVAETPGDIALLQYTSGSTSSPRGVMVTPANLAYNLAYIHEAFDGVAGSVSVSWLPHYHDMGLVGGILVPLWGGHHALLLSPVRFIQRPRRWLEAIARYRATHSGGPDFAYETVGSRGGAVDGLDLSSWRCAFTGAEPIRARTLDRFADRFGAAGFDRRAFYPCYGMAEATLMVTGGCVGAGARTFTDASGRGAWIGCGTTRKDTRVAIVDPHGTRLAPGETGEILVSGPTVAAGYWGRADESRAVFGAQLRGEPTTWLRTGDLGFCTASGELVVTGRQKDLLIVRGENVHPQDLEHTAEQESAVVATHGTAAFAARDGADDEVVIAMELTRDGLRGLDVEVVGQAVADALSRVHDLVPVRVVFLRPGGLPRTTSGKVQRRRCRAQLDQGRLPVAGEWRPAHGRPAGGHGGTQAADDRSHPVVERWLLDVLAAAARVEPRRFDRSTPLAAMGLDSMQAIQLSGRIEERLGRPLPPTLVWDHADVASLAAGLVAAVPDAGIRLSGAAMPAVAPLADAGLAVLDRTDSYTRRMVHLWKAPTSPDIHSALEIDATALEPWLEARRTVPPYVTLEHVVVKAVAEALRRVPDANRRLRAGRVVTRDTVSITTIVTVPAANGRTLIRNVQIEHADRLPVEAIAEDARRRTADLVKGAGAGVADPFARVPVGFWRPLLAAWRHLDINPGRTHFSSAVVSNIGALGAGGLATASAFLPNTRQFPIYWNVALPTIRLQPAVVNGAVVARPTLTLYSTFDHRIFTGPIIAAVYAVLTEVLGSPPS